ncbi:MAG: AMP-binding protein [Gemmatimonadetes bacterium]|nr:AMP-binding protein [Gemmatimonadota bacterium]
MKNLAELLCRRVEATPQRAALTFQSTTLTAQELFDRAMSLRDHLRDSGIMRGDIVAIAADHNPAQVAAMFGAALADAAFTIINPHLRREQILHQLSDCDAKVAIVGPRQLGDVAGILADRGTRSITIDAFGLVEGGGPLKAGRCVKESETRNIPTDVGCLIYTSGSTGRPKGVVLPHRTLTDGARIVSSYLKITEADTLLCILPLSFDYGLNQVLSALYAGARAVIFSYAFPQDLFDIMRAEEITGLAAVPSIWPRILDDRYFKAESHPAFPKLRYITTAGGPHSEQLLRHLTEFFPTAEIIIMYGLTESFRSSCLPFSELFKRIGSIGKAVPDVELLVLDENMQPCPPGQIGELYHRGAFVSYGYLNDPELTAAKFVELPTGGRGTRGEPAVRSGDLVSLDEDGFIYFHGRADTQIKSKGYRVSPTEVEDAAMTLPGLRHAAAFGVPDPDGGQQIVLAYDVYDGYEVETAALRPHVAKILPYYAVPAELLQLHSLPLNPNGKINYTAIKAIWEERKADSADTRVGE